MKNLLVAVDFSDVTDRIITAAEEMARAFGAKIWLLHIVPEAPPAANLGDVPFQWPAMNAESPEAFPVQEHQLQTLLLGLKDKGLNAESMLLQGTTVIEIVSFAERYEIDAIIMGSHGHGALYELMVGTVSEGVLRRAPCPTLIVPSPKAKKV